MFDDMTREELGEYLFKEWEKISTSLLGLSDARVDYYYEEGEHYEDFSYDKCLELLSQTKKYFDTVPVKGTLSTNDLRLYEAANAFRFLPQIFEPKEQKEEFKDICQKVSDMFESLESFSK